MSFPYEELLSENGLADKPVLLSYRTQQMLLMALGEMEKRYNWEEMSDADWDDLDEYIATSETEILTEIENYPMTQYIHAAARTTVQNIAASTVTPIIFNQGNFDPLNPTRLYAPFDDYALLVANIQLNSATNGLKWAAIRENGTTLKARVQFPATGGYYSFSIALPDVFSTAWYYELVVFSTGVAAVTYHVDFNPVLTFYGITP